MVVFWNIIDGFTVIFDQFNAYWLNKAELLSSSV